MREVTVPSPLNFLGPKAARDKKAREAVAEKRAAEERVAEKPIAEKPSTHDVQGATATPADSPCSVTPTLELKPFDAIPVIVLRDEPEIPPLPVGAQPLLDSAAELVISAKKTESQGREVLVQYDGVFLGVYHTPRKITNKTAYQTIATILQGERGEFDPARLRLYRTVELEAPASDEILAGKDVAFFSRFEHRGSVNAVG